MNEFGIRQLPFLKKKGEVMMKKIVLFSIAMVFVVSLGAYAAGFNGVSDFTGRSYDNFEIGPAAAPNSVESTNAGGLRAGDKGVYTDKELYNVSNGKSYDMFEIELMTDQKSVEGQSSGGLREPQGANKASREGIGTSRSYDLPPMNPGLGW
jgi:hypothetical protein